jgi:hypothetical protein
MFEIFRIEFMKQVKSANIKHVFEEAVKHIDTTIIFSFLASFFSAVGITSAFLYSIVVLFIMIFLDHIVKRTMIAHKFGSIKIARKLNFWRSSISREKNAKKIANYSFIICAVFLMTVPLSLYDIGIGFVNTSTLQTLLRALTTFILIGIEFESIMENIKSQFTEEEQEKINNIHEKVKSGTTDIIEMKVENILKIIKLANKKEENNEK